MQVPRYTVRGLLYFKSKISSFRTVMCFLVEKEKVSESFTFSSSPYTVNLLIAYDENTFSSLSFF